MNFSVRQHFILLLVKARKQNIYERSRIIGYAVNSILYQRGIYPPDMFDRVKKYGLPMQISTDAGLKRYLAQVLEQIRGK